VEVALEGHVGDLDLVQPLDRGDRVPPGDDDAQREAVVERQRVAVHRVGEQHRRLVCVLDAEAPLETARLRRVTRSVGAAKDQLGRTGLDAGVLEHGSQRHARPLGRARRAQGPLLAFDGGVEERASVSRALESDRHGLGGHVQDVGQVEAQRMADKAMDLEAPGGWINLRDGEVAADVEALVRCDDPDEP